MTTLIQRAHTVTEVTGGSFIAEVTRLKGPIMRVDSYDEQFDTFAITLDVVGMRQESLIPATLLPFLLREYGEPHEFLGRNFLLAE